MKKLFTSIAFLALCFTGATADVVQNHEVFAASNVVRAFACDNNQSIPFDHVAKAKAVAILTDVVRGAAGVSGQAGRGVLSVKDEYGNWSAPIFIRYRGFGLGLQLGWESSDLVILFQTSKSYRDIFVGENTLEVSAAATFGEGYRAGSSTDLPEVSAWMIQPGKVSGLYAGVSLDFGRITIDNQATYDYYDRIYDYEDILNGSPKDSKWTKTLKNTLAKYLGDRQYYCENCFVSRKEVPNR